MWDERTAPEDHPMIPELSAVAEIYETLTKFAPDTGDAIIQFVQHRRAKDRSKKARE